MSGIAELPYRPGVGMMLFNASGQVFAARRIDMTSEAWQMPQGGIDEHEDPERAMYRELEEEVGLKPSDVTLLACSKMQLTYDLPEQLVPKLWKGRYRGQKQWWYALRLVNEHAINIETDEPEFAEWKWVELEDLPDLIVPFKRDMYQDLVNEFSVYQAAV